MKLLSRKQFGLTALLVAALGATALASAPVDARDFGWGPRGSSHYSGVKQGHHKHHRHYDHTRHHKHSKYHGRVKPDKRYYYGGRFYDRPYVRHRDHYRYSRRPYRHGYARHRYDDSVGLAAYLYGEDGHSVFYYE
jgi:hypothetical protein